MCTADGSQIGIPVAADEIAVFQATEGMKKLRQLKVPTDAQAVCLSSVSGGVAYLNETRLGLLDDIGNEIRITDVGESMEMPRALAYDRSGSIICVSSEVIEGQGAVNRLHTLENPSLKRKSVVDLEGESDSAHFIRWHPSKDVVVIDVACGQDGTWANVVRLDDGGLTRIDGTPPTGEAFGAAGFTSDGKSIVGVGFKWVRLWKPPLFEQMAEFRLPEDHTADYEGTSFGSELVVPIADENEASYLQFLDHSDLMPICKLDLPKQDRLEPYQVMALPHGVVILVDANQKRVFQLVR